MDCNINKQSRKYLKCYLSWYDISWLNNFLLFCYGDAMKQIILLLISHEGRKQFLGWALDSTVNWGHTLPGLRDKYYGTLHSIAVLRKVGRDIRKNIFCRGEYFLGCGEYFLGCGEYFCHAYFSASGVCRTFSQALTKQLKISVESFLYPIEKSTSTSTCVIS